MAVHRAGKRRIDIDINKFILEGKHQVSMLEDPRELLVKFSAPTSSPYKGGLWNVKIKLTEQYPFKPPNICFMNRIYHPNIDEESGVVPFDVVDETWTTRHNLKDIFEFFLPRLLCDPNLINPTNKIAAAMYIHAPQEYNKVIEEYVHQYAKK